MAGIPNFFISSLAQTLNIGGNDTTIKLSNILTQDGQTVSTADFATFNRGIITVNPLSTSSAEFISFTGITTGTSPAGTLTGTLRGLSFKDNTQIAANQKFNPVGTLVIISFGTHNIQDIITYVNNIAIAAGVFATTTTLGTVKMSTTPVLGNSPIAVGDNDNRVSPVSLATVTANQVAALAGTGTPNGTTGKYVTNDDTGTSGSNKVVRFNSNGNLPANKFSSGTTTKDLSDASTAQIIAHGLGVIPSKVDLFSQFAPGTYYVTSTGSFDSSGQRCIYTQFISPNYYSIAASSAIIINPVNNGSQTGTVSVDATNITITWVKGGTPGGTANILWKAEY